jgi:rRNA maturation endonuclease Nob1
MKVEYDTMPGYYDDNFGWYDIESEEDIEFYKRVQRESRMKTCQGCGRRVRLRPDYAICNSCAERAERGMEY